MKTYIQTSYNDIFWAATNEERRDKGQVILCNEYLNKKGQEGWVLIHSFPWTFDRGDAEDIVYIFEKDVNVSTPIITSVQEGNTGTSGQPSINQNSSFSDGIT